MNEINEDNLFWNTIFSFAIVCRADIKQIEGIKGFLSKQGMQIVYQKTSTNKLFIKEDQQ